MKRENNQKRRVVRQVKGKKRVAGRLKTGITHLDKLVGGGFKENTITLVMGGAGSGKTIFAIQFLMEGLKEGESCLYLTFEEKKAKLYDDMSEFGWDFNSYEARGKFFYLGYNPEQVKSLIEEGGGTFEQLIIKEHITRVVIDSITSFSLLYQDELSRKQAGLALFEFINRLGCTAVLTSQNVISGDSSRAPSLEFEADCIITLYHFKDKGVRKRAIEILKMRGTRHANKTFAMAITNKGIVVEQKVIDVD